MADASIKTLIPGYVLAGLFFLACIVVALIQDQHRSVLFLLCLLGAALGWGLGLLFTSAPEEEGSWGRKIMQAVVAGASGFTVAKFQEIANSALVKAILPRFEDVFMGGVLFSESWSALYGDDIGCVSRACRGEVGRSLKSAGCSRSSIDREMCERRQSAGATGRRQS